MKVRKTGERVLMVRCAVDLFIVAGGGGSVNPLVGIRGGGMPLP